MATHVVLQSVPHSRFRPEVHSRPLDYSAAPILSSSSGVSSGNGFGSRGAWLVYGNVKTYLDRSLVRIYLNKNRKQQALLYTQSHRQRSIVCESDNGEDRWGGQSRDGSKCSQHRSSYVRLALSTLPITQPSLDAEETRAWRLDDEIAELRMLQKQLKSCNNLKEKIAVIETSKRVRGAFDGLGRSGIYVKPAVSLASNVLNEEDLYLLKCLVAIGQDHVLDWSSNLPDVHLVRKDSTANTSETPFSSVKEVFTRLASSIESWEESQNQFWQNMPNLVSRNHEPQSIDGKRRDEHLGGVGLPCDDAEEDLLKLLTSLIHVLERLENFYDSIGGIIGYQVTALELIKASETGNHETSSIIDGSCTSSPSLTQFTVPLGPDLSKDKAFATKAASWGLEGLPAMGEIYPLGGAGDRLGLVDDVTGECLPVAMLPYCGRTLLEGLIRDLQAREFLHFKVFGEQHITPVAIMTSAAKKNNDRVLALCNSHNWFGRSRESFRLFEQPLVPTVAAADGQWLVTEPLTAVLKPGGHGVIWKLAHDEGVLKWFQDMGRKAAIVRQISNPIAATDCTLLGLSGIGLRHNKKFGFASCHRNVGTAEGVNVLMEKRLGDGSWEYAVTCIEYTEFNKLGILDVPVSSGSMQAQFPANTNVLFVDLASVERIASSQSPASLPGMIMNLKKPVEYVDHLGHKHSVLAGRLECTMQNIADSLSNQQFSRLSHNEYDKLDTYLIYNQRRKVTSSAKRRRKQGDHSLHQTPDGSFLDVTRNAFDLLTYCGVSMPEMEGHHCYVDSGPPFIVLIHPAMGPLWDVIRQKIQGGALASGAELQLEIAEFSWKDVQLDGSLVIRATNIMGSTERNDSGEPILRYGAGCGRCKLNQVQVKNKGVDWNDSSNVYWQNKVQRADTLEIILDEDAEFEASDVTIEGSHKFFVPRGHRMIVTGSNTGMSCVVEKLSRLSPGGRQSWSWKYDLQENGEVVLTMVDQ